MVVKDYSPFNGPGLAPPWRKLEHSTTNFMLYGTQYNLEITYL